MALSKLLLAALAVAANVVNSEVVVAVNPLINYSHCNATQQNQIYEAWFDALKIANVAKDGFGDWKGDAEIEYFGPPSLNHPHQRNIQVVGVANEKRKDLLSRAAGLSRPWWSEPTQSKIHANCDDWAKKCKDGGPVAYTSQRCPGGESVCITFCTGFFPQPSLNDVLANALSLENENVEKLHMNTYQSRGSALLHEILHISDISFPLGHVYDRLVRFKKAKR
ncbi:hypothetical protein FQN49_005670 [Arthroderma sp. PD_2]|nr:hypothetical protein FQN49_005670 [Arthroderma sp. PD_2]